MRSIAPKPWCGSLRLAALASFAQHIVRPSMSGLALHSPACGLGSVNTARLQPFTRALQPQRFVARRRLLISNAAIEAKPASLDIKSFEGEKSGSQNLALRVAADNTAKGLVHRYLVTVRQNARAGTASTKTRAEVRGGGRKPYAQKGTGNARQGSIRTPLKPGGGVVFGPKPKDWSIRMNKKERRLAMGTALQSANANITVVEDLKNSFDVIKTKSLVQALERWGVDQEEYGLLIINETLPKLELSARNVEKLKLNIADSLSVYDVLRADKIVIEKSALEYIQEFYGASEKAAVPSRQKTLADSTKKPEVDSKEKQAAKAAKKQAKASKQVAAAKKKTQAKQASAGKKQPAKQ